MSILSVYIISDSLGETGEQVAKAAISQFELDDYDIKRFPYVLNLKLLSEILKEASNESNAVLFYTLVDKEFIEYIKDFTAESGLIAVDLLSPLIAAIRESTHLEPAREPGTIRKLDEAYFKRVEAIEFAVKYDDGKDPRGLSKADVVILGISRTSKTPLSMYLANKNIKVANVPLVPESVPPKEIYEVPAKRVIGLTNSPTKLNEIREERLKALGLPKGSSYASMERILDEIDYAEKIMKKIGCPIIDVSNKAIEETAELIISILKRNGIKVFKD
ncbi:MAG: [pyruvate, water dikinase]-phosphate phosphotransferase / [pyruvate, water dikinase] kinase [Peptostreptococcaceae bacterium]|uniref:pyruvate, water dikinase regulatory protein n=1 Tax=Acetoanaerobium noterae TaxID=745369 RepID=UPI0028AA790C|nr:pyruvate, water dikinase regulatory protein [Acetoanaerobium noterae]MDK2803648.1 [pyruvate, water dikinase]-phosphate phosphotransferase / [pyruvate, water dikinase] kinase [Peptostreptococcaceae bacterium]